MSADAVEITEQTRPAEARLYGRSEYDSARTGTEVEVSLPFATVYGEPAAVARYLEHAASIARHEADVAELFADCPMPSSEPLPPAVGLQTKPSAAPDD